METSEGRAPTRGQAGFVLGFVVLLLFGISVASATGYLVVNSDFAMARFGSQRAEALAAARAGLQRFAAEQIGVVGDSVSYVVGNGIALVTSQRVYRKDSLTFLYYLRSEATVSDYSALAQPAVAVVGGYAWHHRRPLRHLGAVITASNTLRVHDDGEVRGRDRSRSDDCPGGGTAGIPGGIARVSVTGKGTLNGTPDSKIWPGGAPAILDSVALRWDVLKNPAFPVDFEDAPPNFSALPADSFPVVRYNGSLYADNSWDGRGVLIVTGEFDSGPDHDWDGIVLAGWFDDIMQGDVRGIVIGGLAGPSPYASVEWRGDAEYFSCYVYKANDALSYMRLLGNTVFELN